MIDERLVQCKLLLQQNGIDAILISSIPNIIYLTNFNHFLVEEREAFLLITKNKNYIFTDKRYTLAVQKHIKNFVLREIAYMHGFEDWMKKICQDDNIKILGIEEDNITVKELKKITPYVKIIKHFDLSSLRSKKSLDEMTAIKKACVIGDKTFRYILKQLKPNMTEKEIALLMESFIKKYNAELSFNTIVAIAEDAAFIHHKTNEKKLKTNKMILLDFGVKYKNYCSDMSRTIIFGKATKKQKEVYNTVLAAQQKAITFIKNKLKNNEEIKTAEVDKIARDYIIEKSFPSFTHALGHGIGLEVHEPPFLRPIETSTLTDGNIFSIEPGIYLPNKFGVRIEDLFAIQNNKLIQLTKSSRKLIEISINEAKI